MARQRKFFRIEMEVACNLPPRELTWLGRPDGTTERYSVSASSNSTDPGSDSSDSQDDSQVTLHLDNTLYNVEVL